MADQMVARIQYHPNPDTPNRKARMYTVRIAISDEMMEKVFNRALELGTIEPYFERDEALRDILAGAIMDMMEDVGESLISVTCPISDL